jgi:glutaredoxin
MLRNILKTLFLGTVLLFTLNTASTFATEEENTLKKIVESEIEATTGVLDERREENDTSVVTSIEIHFFDDRLCGVCKETKEFIQSLQSDYPQINLQIHSISDTKKLNEFITEFGIENYSLMSPTIFINSQLFQFNDFTSNTKETIISAIEGKTVYGDSSIIKIPFTNIEANIGALSLPVVTIVLGSIDGFNVCSIGALILVLSIVLILDSRKKIFLYGGIFIATAVLIYGVLVFVWGKVFELLVGQLEILRIVVGLAALGGAIFFAKEFWRFFRHGVTCKSSNSKLIRKSSSKLREVFENPGKKAYLLIGSIMFFAAVVTIVELPCSIGIPIAFTGILVEKGVSMSAYIGYILMYLFFYMLIEIIIFTGAVLTKRIWFANSKAITWITFAGALVLFYLALHYLIGY